MDVSDGLLSDLGHICKASRVSAVIYLDQLPIRPETQSHFSSSANELALSGGEDYQLLFTAKSDIVKEVQKNSNYPVTVIGEINRSQEMPVRVVAQNGLDYHPINTGWDHFGRKK